MPDTLLTLRSSARCAAAAAACFVACLGMLSPARAASLTLGAVDTKEQVRPLTGIRGVATYDAVRLVLKNAPTVRVTVRALDDMLPLVETRVVGGRLDVRLKPHSPHWHFGDDPGVVVTVEAPELSSIASYGSGNVTGTGLKSDLMQVSIEGSGSVELPGLEVGALALRITGSGGFTASGRAATQGIAIVGSGDVHCRNLEGRQVAVQVRGSGDAHVHATERLEVEIDGSGDVRYRGAPRVEQRIHGSGDVIRDD